MVVESFLFSPPPPLSLSLSLSLSVSLSLFLSPYPPFFLFSHCLQKSHGSDWDNIYKRSKMLVRTNAPIKAPLLALPYGKPPLPSTFNFLYFLSSSFLFFLPLPFLSSPLLSSPFLTFPLLPPPPERNDREGMKEIGRGKGGKGRNFFLLFSSYSLTIFFITSQRRRKSCMVLVTLKQ